MESGLGWYSNNGKKLFSTWTFLFEQWNKCDPPDLLWEAGTSFPFVSVWVTVWSESGLRSWRNAANTLVYILLFANWNRFFFSRLMIYGPCNHTAKTSAVWTIFAVTLSRDLKSQIHFYFFLNINIWSLRRYIIARLYVKRVDNCSMGMWYFLSRYYSILYADNIFYPMNNNCFLAHVEGWNKDKKTIRTDELISRGCDRLTFGYLWCNLPLPSLLSGSVWGSPVNKDNVAPQVRHLVKLPKPGPVYCGAVKATRQPHKLRMIYSTAAVMNADFNDTYEDKKQDGWKDASLREGMAICAVVHLQNHNHKTFHCSRCTEINFKKKSVSYDSKSEMVQ